MNTKQTPEHEALEALQVYTDKFGRSDNQYAARQSIIKAFQDRDSLLDALEAIALKMSSGHGFSYEWMVSDMKATALAAIEKAKP